MRTGQNTWEEEAARAAARIAVLIRGYWWVVPTAAGMSPASSITFEAIRIRSLKLMVQTYVDHRATGKQYRVLSVDLVLHEKQDMSSDTLLVSRMIGIVMKWSNLNPLIHPLIQAH